MVVWICLPHIAATSSNGGSLFWVKTTTYFKSVSNYKGSSHHLHREVINISPPPCLPPHQQCSIATASSCRSLSTRYESPLKPFHFNGRAWQFIIHCIHCSTAATVQEVSPTSQGQDRGPYYCLVRTRPLSVPFLFRTSGKGTDTATPLGLEKYGRIDFALGRWTAMGQNAPKSMRAHARDWFALVRIFFRLLTWL